MKTRNHTVLLRDYDRQVSQLDGYTSKIIRAKNNREFVRILVVTLQKRIEELLSKKKDCEKILAAAEILALFRTLIKLRGVNVEEAKRKRGELVDKLGGFDAQLAVMYTRK
jgi:hypothetical protein